LVLEYTPYGSSLIFSKRTKRWIKRERSDTVEMIGLADGTNVPKACVDALEKFEHKWPGATFPMARAAIVREVLKAYKKEMKKDG
jgi:hypothetical protein